ncbi:AAA family ATPase [Sphingomonas sp. ACRSK]|uniref:AAA family ATPase n=1 Tax=Sphingomonas sp. ACRSK TaxID=2918213 RepID=UPI001EF6F191|nr:AAA family ATPase [Sphingomonas sp. ACRSK]MCG7348882.1 AAA family ATPase [Sphingomonas sp. ACRSK]
MRIGFCGAHRTGKTTLARAIARIYHLPLLSSSASAVAARHSFDMAHHNRLDTGIPMQVEQLDTMIEGFEERTEGFVSDRTPLDAAAYLLADATASAGTPLSRETTVTYVEKAMALTAKHFDIVILVPPAITFEPMDGKPPMNEAYQEHHHMLVRGMLFDDEVSIRSGQIQRTNTSRLDRISAVLEFCDPIAREKGMAVPCDAEQSVAA